MGDAPMKAGADTDALVEAFTKERKTEWEQFCHFTTYGIVGVTVLLILMKVFLVH